jgi:CRISPR/Cas system CSM-associated protein Csm2 small subunit
MTIDQINIKDIYEFMESGNPANAPAHIVEYLELLDKVRGMFLRIDKFGNRDMIIKHLMTAEKLSRFKAAQVCDEAREYFYSETRISKQAWKNIYADKMEMMINFAMQTVKDVSDAQKVVKMLMDVAVIRGINEPDVEEIPAEVFQPPFVVYSCDAEFLGMPKVNRQKLGEMIDKFPELTEKEKIQIKREAMVLPIKLFPNEQEDARKS